MGRKKLAIIDGKSIFYRGYYAMPNLSTKDGTPTGGVYGFAVLALELIKKLQPDYVCVAWDKPKTNIRKRLEMYPAYKAGRKPAPPDFYDQIPLLHELLEAFGWPLYELDDFEADDIMGALALQARQKDIETLLITSDLDALQLISGHVHVYALKKGFSNIDLFHPESFTARYGIRPDQFLDLKALKGDASDNIPGVSGIGEKGAIELLQQFESLDGIYQNLDLVKDSVRKKLEAGKESAYLSKKLAAIWTDAPVPLNLSTMDGSKCSPAKVQEILQKLEFRTLARQLPEYMHVPEQKQASLNKKLDLPTEIKVENDQDLAGLTWPSDGETVVHALSSQSHGREPQLLVIAPDKGDIVTFDLTKLSHNKVRKCVQKYLESRQLVGYNLKASLQVLRSIGINARNISHDALIGAFLLNPLRREQGLDELAAADLGVHLPTIEENGGKSVWPATIAVIRKLTSLQRDELHKIPRLAALNTDIELPVIPVLADMEYTGIQLDTVYLKVISAQIDDMVSDLEQQIYGHADSEFNISSPSQLADVLFEKLQLPKDSIKRGKTGFSTAASELEKLRPIHPIIDLIIQYREVTKLKNTYIDTLPKMVDEGSRLHTTYNLTIAQTGRLSSTDPNLQNIPVRTELGKQIRQAFIAGEGNMLVSADYSQFELRLAAVLADDKELIEMFNQGADIHTMTAAQVYGRDPEDVSKQMRRDAKVINFGVLYGMSPHGLSVATGMSREQAKTYIDKYFELRKPLLEYLNKLKEKARKDGYVETLFGRRRPMPDIKSSNFMVRMAAERAAINMPIQGTEADLMKMAMIKVSQKLAGSECKLLLQIHDSILVECPESEAKATAELLKTTMESVYKLPVNLDVDTTIGQNWGEL